MRVAVTLLAGLLALCAASVARGDIFEGAPGVVQPADLVVVRKAQRRLTLYRDGRQLKDYRISLGLNPTGHKQREGDFRTPEGHYQLTRRNGCSITLALRLGRN